MHRAPFAALVWKFNWLYLPSLTILVINMLLYWVWFDKGYHVTTRGTKRGSMDLVKPHYWALTELGVVLGYFPAALLAGLMRCIYVLCVALLGVLRVDSSLLPSGLQTFDSPYMCFAAYALRLNKADSPLVVVAVDMLRAGVVRHHREDAPIPAVDPSNATAEGSLNAAARRLRVRNRLHLVLTLSLFPTLIPLRKHYLDTKRVRAESNKAAQEQAEKSSSRLRGWVRTPAPADVNTQAATEKTAPQQAAHDATAATKPEEPNQTTGATQDHTTVAQI